MNTEDSEFARIEREATRGIPDAIHHTDTSESLEYIQGWNDCRQAMLAEQPAQPAQQEPVAHSAIAGALFDFMGWLTSRKERLVLSGADEASPAVDAIRDFAKMRGLSLDDAKVQDWHTAPQAQRKPLEVEE